MNRPTSYGVCVPCCCRCGRRGRLAPAHGRHYCPRHAPRRRPPSAQPAADAALLRSRGSLDSLQLAAARGVGASEGRKRLARLRAAGLAVAVPGTLPVRHVPSGGRG